MKFQAKSVFDNTYFPDSFQDFQTIFGSFSYFRLGLDACVETMDSNKIYVEKISNAVFRSKEENLKQAEICYICQKFLKTMKRHTCRLCLIEVCGTLC